MTTFENTNGTTYEIIMEHRINNSLLSNIALLKSPSGQYIVAHGLDVDYEGTWARGEYFMNDYRAANKAYIKAVKTLLNSIGF